MEQVESMSLDFRIQIEGIVLLRWVRMGKFADNKNLAGSSMSFLREVGMGWVGGTGAF